MSEHLSLETCKRLQEAGCPHEEGLYWLEQEGHVGMEWNPPLRRIAGGAELTPCYSIITADGKGGVLPWLESKGWHIQFYLGDIEGKQHDFHLRAYKQGPLDGNIPANVHASTFEALFDGVLEAMRVPSS